MTYYSALPRSDELYHYGIKGQKWGVRRFENKDGTLTKAGKERYSDSQKKQDARLYGKRSVKRIQKRVDDGETIISARHAEVLRKKRRDKAITIASIAVPAALSATLLGYLNHQENKIEKARMKRINDLRESTNKLIDAYMNKNHIQSKRGYELPESFKKALRNPGIKKSLGDTQKGEVSDTLKKLLNNNPKGSSFEEKMKEYWNNGGREKWERKNRKNKP